MKAPTERVSYGQRLAKQMLAAIIPLEPMENHRPAWLNGLKLDFHYPEWKFAIEFQGDQHYFPVFGQDALDGQKRRDAIKRNICREYGVVLLQIKAIDLSPAKLLQRICYVAPRDMIPMIRKDQGNPLKMLEQLRILGSLTGSYRHFLRSELGSKTAGNLSGRVRRADDRDSFKDAMRVVMERKAKRAAGASTVEPLPAGTPASSA